MGYKKKLAVLLFVQFLLFRTIAQVPSLSFREVDSLQKTEQRPLFVFLYAGWCSWCEAMKATTFKHAEVSRQLQAQFYFVQLDIEEKKPIDFRKRHFKFKPTGYETGVHELAEQLGTIDGVLQVPGICVLNGANEIIFQGGGYLAPKEFLALLTQARKAQTETVK